MIVLGLLLAACSKPAVYASNLDSCYALYNHIVDLTVQQDVGDNKQSPQYANAWQATDEEFQQRGTTTRFFKYCLTMSDKQIACGVTAKSKSDINLCSK